MRRYPQPFIVVLLALSIGGIGLAAPAEAAPSDSYPAVIDQAMQQGWHVEVFDFNRVSAAGTRHNTGRHRGDAGDDMPGRRDLELHSGHDQAAGGSSVFTTPTRCADTNMRKLTDVHWTVNACVIFVDHATKCNYDTTLSTSWKTIATNVADKTHFHVEVVFAPADGTTTVQLAF